MRVRSKALWQYLEASGALSQGEEAIQTAKAAYRREYKRTWKAKRIIKKFDIRLSLTPKEYKELKVWSALSGCRPATASRMLVLAACAGKAFVPHREKLLEALQGIGIAANSLLSFRYRSVEIEEVLQTLMKAETLIADFLKQSE